MNDSTIQMIAQAVIANTKVIQSLIDALPHDAKVAVAEIASPTPAPAPAPVAMPAPAPVAMPAPAPAPVAMPAPAPAPAPATAAAAPFTDVKGMIDYVMGVYRELGPQKGAQIQNVLTGLGYQNINDVTPEHYSALFQGVEQLKVA